MDRRMAGSCSICLPAVCRSVCLSVCMGLSACLSICRHDLQALSVCSQYGATPGAGASGVVYLSVGLSVYASASCPSSM